jgi:hypothetical protein
MGSGEETSDDISLEHALFLAQSWGWSRRKLAARALARYAEDDRAFEALDKMLDDADIAVIEESVASLTVGAGKRGLREVLRRLALSEDNAGYHIRDKLASLWFDGVPVLDLCREIASAESEKSVSEGAMEMIQFMTRR